MDKIICKQCNKEFLNYKSNHRVFCSNNGFNNNNSEQLCNFLGCIAVAQEA